MEQDLSLVGAGLEAGQNPFEDESSFSLHDLTTQTTTKSVPMDITLGMDSVRVEQPLRSPLQVRRSLLNKRSPFYSSNLSYLRKLCQRS